VWRINGIILAGKSTKYPEETCCTANFSSRYSKQTGLGSKPGLLGERPATDALRFRPVITLWIEVERKKK
jgi:hypothetical protein